MNITENQQTGKASISFHRPVFIQSCASVAGKKEGEGPLGSCFDQVWEDPMFGMDTWEAAESTMQKQAAFLAIQKAGLSPQDLRMVFAGRSSCPDYCLFLRNCRYGHSLLRTFRCLFYHG